MLMSNILYYTLLRYSVTVLHPTRHKIYVGHFADVLPSRSVG